MLRIVCAQINCTVGDLEGNSLKIMDYLRKAKEYSANIAVFPELTITGYPPEDLLYKPKFIEDNLRKLKEITESVEDLVAIVGFVDKRDNNLYNAAAVISEHKVKGIYHKMILPNYGVFDEKRYFKPGDNPLVFKLNDRICGVNICEDIWHKDGPIKLQVSHGAQLILNINASPYYAGKIRDREEIIRKQAKENKIDIAYINLVGGQDEIVFDGQSMIVNREGEIINRAEAFREDLMIADLPVRADKENSTPIALEKKELEPSPYLALLLGLKDYVHKNGFKKVVLGLSGGIDSSLVATLAVDALGKENVTGIFMPTRYSSEESRIDVHQLTKNLDIKLINVSIEQIYKMYLTILEPHFAGMKRDVTEENLQARIRANVIMAFSNKFGWLVLTTGNKSEMSTGYATLYGDMAGGLAVIKDVPKTLVYELAKYRNTISNVVPERVLTKEPTAELKMNQRDRDTLPDYEILDSILKAYVEEDKHTEEITSPEFPEETVRAVINMVDKSEYKRKQSAPGIKITPKAFGKDRRMPITNGYKN